MLIEILMMRVLVCLIGFSLIWGFILGFVLAAVSPAVVVPSLIALQEKGLGVEQGIPSLVIAAASLDDIFAILGFSLALGWLVQLMRNALLFAEMKAILKLLIALKRYDFLYSKRSIGFLKVFFYRKFYSFRRVSTQKGKRVKFLSEGSF